MSYTVTHFDNWTISYKAKLNFVIKWIITAANSLHICVTLQQFFSLIVTDVLIVSSLQELVEDNKPDSVEEAQELGRKKDADRRKELQQVRENNKRPQPSRPRPRRPRLTRRRTTQHLMMNF